MAAILIAGCGYVGSELACRLVAEGHGVWGLRRRPAGLPAGVRPAAADLTDAASLASLFADPRGPRRLDGVVYAAAADRGEEAAYRAAYVDGPARLLVALEAAGERPRRVLFTSSTGVYGQRDGSWVDEESPAEPGHFTGRLLLQGERRLLASRFPATVVRLGGIYGPGRTRLLERVRRGEAACREGPPRWINRIHRDDAAGLLHLLIQLALRDEQLESVYLGVDGDPGEECQVLRWLAARLGVAPPRTEREPPGAAGRGRSNKRCRNDRVRALGYRFRYPSFREGYGALLAGMASGATGS